jgi:inner membrane protein
VLCHTKFALTILGLLGVLYCYLFVVLQLEDYALLLGSVGLFVVLACVMYVTRSIDWYQMDTSGEA